MRRRPKKQHRHETTRDTKNSSGGNQGRELEENTVRCKLKHARGKATRDTFTTFRGNAPKTNVTVNLDRKHSTREDTTHRPAVS